MAVANGSLEYDSPAASTPLAHGSGYPEAEGSGRLAFQTLKTEYEPGTNFKPWDLERQLRYVRMTPEDRLHPARLITEEVK